MKEIKVLDSVEICDGKMEVKPYLSYAEIQSVCEAVCKFDNWAERQQNIDILLLHFATNLTDEEIENIGHEDLVKSGIIDEVKENVRNYNRIQEAIEYTESTTRALTQIIKEIPNLVKVMKKVDKNASKSSKK